MYSAGQKYRWLIFSGRTRFSALLVAQQNPRDSAAGLWGLKRAVCGKDKRLGTCQPDSLDTSAILSSRNTTSCINRAISTAHYHLWVSVTLLLLIVGDIPDVNRRSFQLESPW